MGHPDDRRPRQTLVRSFHVAGRGLCEAFRDQRNLRLHTLMTALVIIAGWASGLSAMEWSLLALAIGLVWVAELVNTAIEAAVDLASPEHHELARIAKDVASAAVLLAAVTSVAVGAFLFGPRLWTLLTHS